MTSKMSEGELAESLIPRLNSIHQLFLDSKLREIELICDNSNDVYEESNNCNSKHIGILAIDVYTPSTFTVPNRLLDCADMKEGQYDMSLDQIGVSICGDCEDVNSLSLTAVKSLMEKYDIKPSEVGRLDVGTATIIDKTSITNSVLMDLFGDERDIKGTTVVNSCNGGSIALLNAFSWVENDGWDGRFAIVVASDIGDYTRESLRLECGSGAVALLVGRDAPISFSDPRLKATHTTNLWGFSKTDQSNPCPQEKKIMSKNCNYRALEDCYLRFTEKIDRLSSISGKQNDFAHCNAESSNYYVFHCPCNKLIHKSYARLFLLDARKKHQHSLLISEKKKKKVSYDVNEQMNCGKTLEQWLEIPIEETYCDEVLDTVLQKVSAASFKLRVEDANALSKKIGDTCSASVLFGIASLIDSAGRHGELNAGKTLTVCSCGVNAVSSMFRLIIRVPAQTRFTLENMTLNLDLISRLDSREELQPCELDYALMTRERIHRARAPYSPVYPTIGRLFPGTYYLNEIDSRLTRTYSRVPLNANIETEESSLDPPNLWRLPRRKKESLPIIGKLQNLVDTVKINADKVSLAKTGIVCVITGVSAGLPGGNRSVFSPENLNRLVSGDQCIEPITGSTKAALLDKNVVHTHKNPDGSIKRVLVNTEAEAIKLAAQLGNVDLSSSYGVPEGLAETMDIAAQVAVAAGMEALKDAGLVSGKSNDPNEWKLPECYRDRTGVVYASSFPAMDAAIGEVMRFLQSKTVEAADTMRLISALRSRLIQASPNRVLSRNDETAFSRLLLRASEITDSNKNSPSSEKDYVFDRKFLFRVLVLANAQLAQLAGCKGPNTQTNAACAGTTQAIGMAQDMLISGRADRVVVVAGDNASGPTLLPWLGSGFRALGAATTAAAIKDAALPFDKRRSGMLLGAGGIGMVLETEASSLQRLNIANAKFTVKAFLLATQYSNSAFHGAALDRNHIASELKRFLFDIELIHGINKADIAINGVYFSHETSTHASDVSSCSGNEVAALRMVFGNKLFKKILILNTKGYTGHPMGVSFEDVAAVEVLNRQHVPPVVNYSVKDEYLGDINISKGGPYACHYALRFAAGFGSQVAFALYASTQ